MNPPEGMHRGIEVRARLVDCPPDRQVIMQADSDALHYIAEWGTDAGKEWAQLLPPILNDKGKPWLLIEHRPVILRNEWPEGDE